MSWPLLFTTKHNITNRDTSSNLIQTSIEIHANEEEGDNEEYVWHELRISENESLLTSLNRICIYWRQLVLNKIRFILTFVFVPVLNIATQLSYFIRHKTTTPLSSIEASPSYRTLDKDINHTSTSTRHFNSQLDLPSLDNSSMANMLVRQQTSNINIHQPTSTHDEPHSPMARSVDDRLFFYRPDSTSLLQFLQKFASEPQMSMYHPTTTPSSNTFVPLNQSEEEEEEEEINDLNCDQIQPVNIEDAKSNQLDNISTATTTINDLDGDILLNIDSSLNTDRHFRRRKRRSSLTRTSLSNDETETLITDCIEKIDNNNNNNTEVEKSQEINENLPPISIESLSLDENNEKTVPSNRLRGRRLRYRLYRHTPPTSEEPISDNTIQFYVPNETPTSSPLPSPTSPTAADVPSFNTSPNALTGRLKRNGSIGTTKKMVRFADSVGRELAQVQYIPTSTDDDSKDFLSVKKNSYAPKTLNFEHKPWSFDFALPSKQMYDTPIPKRFFCLYRQPNSEHPDIYLHEIWKSQIKLEHADIRLKSSSTGEQYLNGTLWVTNASYWKNVTVKYSFNRWLNTYEYEAQHRCHSNDFRNIDQFEFSIDIPHDVDRIDFVLRYYVNGQEHWDNNEGKNYTLETESASTPQTTISLPHDCDFNEMRFY